VRSGVEATVGEDMSLRGEVDRLSLELLGLELGHLADGDLTMMGVEFVCSV
jgi:hypothetical protein